MTLFPLVIHTGIKTTTLGIGNVMQTQGNSGTGADNIPVSPSAPIPLRVTEKNAASNGTDTAGSDYAATSGTPISSTGQKNKTVPSRCTATRLPCLTRLPSPTSAP